MELLADLFALIIGILAATGLLMYGIIMWDSTTKLRHNLKSKLFPKWEAKFNIGEHVAVNDGNGRDTLCIVRAIDKANPENIIEYYYKVSPTHDFNGHIDPSREWFDYTWFKERALSKIK